MQLTHGVLQDEAQSAVSGVLEQDILHDIPRILLVLLVASSYATFDDTDADDLVSIVHQFVQQPLQGIVGVGMLVHSHHEGP